jgi:PAS domain S-box-containing protein
MSMDDLATAPSPTLARFARTAAALRASPEFIEKLPLAIYACDADGRILWFNARAAELWGRTPLLGNGAERFCGSHKLYFDGRPIAREETPMASVLRTGIAVRGVQGRIERPDGSSIWCMVHIEPVEDEDGTIIGAINCFHETTALHRTEELLHEQDERLAVTYEHAAVGIAEVDANGILLRVNARLCGMMGFSAEQLQGRSIFDETFPEDRERDHAQFRRQAAGEIDRYTIEKRIRRSDGTYAWVAITSSSVRDAQGQFLYAVRVQNDINDRKRAEESLARRMDEQAALYAFTERLQHAASLQDVYEPALDAIIRALRCERASILLSDDGDVMRFVAWRGLSDAYRRVVDGHSPWTSDTRNPQPVCIADVEGAELPESFKQTVRTEGMAALAFIPLIADGRLLGKFMAYFDAPHAFTDAEIDVAMALARHLGFAVERMRADAARRAAERAAQQLASIVESSDDAIYSEGSDGIITTWNRGAAQLFGYEAAEAVGRPVTMLIPPDRLDEDLKSLARCRAGERLHQHETIRVRKDGSRVDVSLTVSPMYDARGRIIGVSKIARDMTERNQAARAALQLASIVESSDDAIISKDLDGIITTWNRAAERLFGYTAAEAVGQPVTILIPPERLAEEPDILARIRRGERIEHFETVRRRKDGSAIDISLTISPMKDARGRVVGASKIARDITESKQAARAALQLASIVESSDDAIISKDLDGVITTWNRGAERLFGYTAAEAVGRPVTILIPSERLDEEPRILSRIRRGERIEHFETIRRRKDGSLVEISLTVSPMKDSDGRTVGASKIARDITESKQAEAKLRDSERRLQELLAAIPAAIYTTDAQGRVTYYNEAAAELAGRTPVIGSDEWCVTWKLYRPDGTPLPHAQCPMALSLKEGRPIRGMEAVAERPDGTRVPFIPYPTPLRDAAGKVVGAINMLVDVSERKQAETQQRILLNELNHRVKNNMQMLQSLLYSSAKQTQNAEAKRVLAEACGRIAAMAAAQRVLYGTTGATKCGAREFIDAVCGTAQQVMPPNVRIACEAASGEISNDTAVPLALILNELLTNAAKYGVDGSGGTIRVGLSREPDAFILSVEDDGPGFDLQAVRGRSSGLRLVEGLSRQIRGHFDVTRTPATRCTLRFQRGDL